MFKKLSIVLLAAFALQHLAAQKASQNIVPITAVDDFPKFEVGIQGGPSYSFFFNERPMLSPRNIHRPVYRGGLFGISYQYNFTKMIGLRVEANYERKGDIYYDISSWLDGSTYERSYAFDRINYVTVPVTARMSFGRNIRFLVNTGLYAGVRINAKRITYDASFKPFASAGEQTVKMVSTSTDITTDTKAVDGGVIMGLGVLFPIESVAAITIEARNTTGFISPNANTGLYQNRFYNNSTNLMMGLSFYLDRISKPRSALRL